MMQSMDFTKLVAAALAALTLTSVTACDGLPAGPDALSGPAQAVSSGHSISGMTADGPFRRPGTFFLPPLSMANPEPQGFFDARLLGGLEVQICLLGPGGCAETLASMTATTQMPGRLRLEEEDGLRYYMGSWKVKGVGPTDRVRAILSYEGEDVSWIDISTASMERTLPVRFWIAEGAVYGYQRELFGDPTAPAGPHVPNVDFEPRQEDYSTDHPTLGGMYISYNTLLLSIASGSTIQEVNALLADLGAQIVGGIPAPNPDIEAIAFLRLPTSTHADVESILESLRSSPFVDAVAPDVLVSSFMVPGDNDGTPADWTWEVTASGGNWGLELTRVPQMWNLNDATVATVRTGVFDVGFRMDHRDLTIGTNLSPGVVGYHGTHVAGIIGADFDNGRGVDGVNPFADLVVQAVGFVQGVGFFQSIGAMFINGYHTLLEHGAIRVVNISMGYNWAGNYGIDANANPRVHEIVRNHGRLFRTLLATLDVSGDLPLIVAAAGNDSNDGLGLQEARWASPFNYAGLVLDPPGGRSVPLILVVESDSLDEATGRVLRSDFSNIGGNISAPGSRVSSTTTSDRGDYEVLSGTSMAAPHVTGLISYLYSLTPNLTHAEVWELLSRNAEPVGPDVSPRIDAYRTVLDIDRLRGDYRIRRGLLDVTNDGVLDADDLSFILVNYASLTPFKPICEADPEADGCRLYSRYDLNGDGQTASDGLVPFDLNSDGQLGIVAQSIAGEEYLFDEITVSDRDVVCYSGASAAFNGSDTDLRDAVLSAQCGGEVIRVVLDDPVVRELTVDLPDPRSGGVGADVVFNVDMSGSFSNDLATFRTRAYDIANALASRLSDLRVGVTSFIDAPCGSFGGSTDYGHRLDLALTGSITDFKTTLDGLSTGFGADGPESQLESMYQTITGQGYDVPAGTSCETVADIAPSTVGWENDRLRFLMHATDAPFHRPIDAGYPYPTSVEDLIAVAQGTGTRIYFLDSGGSTDAAKTAIAAAAEGQVFRLDAASTEIVIAIAEAADAAITSATIRLVPEGDDAGLVASISPEVFTDVDLTAQDQVTFTVTFVNTVTPGPEPQVFRFELVATVDGAEFDRRAVEVVIPAI